MVKTFGYKHCLRIWEPRWGTLEPRVGYIRTEAYDRGGAGEGTLVFFALAGCFAASWGGYPWIFCVFGMTEGLMFLRHGLLA
eukprot:8647121-Pyramimonas_sp.AAC.1